MSPHENPFTPSFGEIPAHLAGRESIVRAFRRALVSERRRPELTTLVSGARGTGKTTLLSVLSEQADASGWISANTTALPGMFDDLELEIHRKAQHLAEKGSGARIASVGIPQLLEVKFDRTKLAKSNWRSRIGEVLDALEEKSIGLLITVDEVDPSLSEMVELAAVYQHFVRENRKVALLMAGLPHNISALLADKIVSFLRRAQQERLSKIPDYDVGQALLKTIRENGREVESEGVELAVQAIGGFPFLLQLVGYHAWEANEGAETVSTDDFERGIEIARNEMRGRILEATFREMSPGDVKFARAMLEDVGDSRTADVAQRLGWSSAQVGQYRRRLIDEGVIGSRGRGIVGFDLPYFREYLDGMSVD